MQYLGSIRGDEEYLKYLQKLSRYKLLILDDFGVSPLKANESRDLLEIIEDRSKISSTIITSQLAIKEWHFYIHSPTVADEIRDRIVDNSYKIEITCDESVIKLENSISFKIKSELLFSSLCYIFFLLNLVCYCGIIIVYLVET